MGINQNLKTHWQASSGYLVVTVLMNGLCYGLIGLSGRKLEKLPVKIKAAKTVDKEIEGFLLVYLLPLMNQTYNTISLPGSFLITLYLAGELGH